MFLNHQRPLSATSEGRRLAVDLQPNCTFEVHSLAVSGFQIFGGM